MGIAVMVDPKSSWNIRQDSENYLVLVKVEPGKPFVYYTGAAVGTRVSTFNDRAAWEAYVP